MRNFWSHSYTEAKPVLASKFDWPLWWPCDLGLTKNQMYISKDPHMQNFRSFGSLWAELQLHPSSRKSGLCCPPLSNIIVVVVKIVLKTFTFQMVLILEIVMGIQGMAPIVPQLFVR